MVSLLHPPLPSSVVSAPNLLLVLNQSVPDRHSAIQQPIPSTTHPDHADAARYPTLSEHIAIIIVEEDRISLPVRRGRILCRCRVLFRGDFFSDLLLGSHLTLATAPETASLRLLPFAAGRPFPLSASVGLLLRCRGRVPGLAGGLLLAGLGLCGWPRGGPRLGQPRVVVYPLARLPLRRD